MILIIASRDDPHALAVRRECEKLGAQVQIYDPSSPVSKVRLIHRISSKGKTVKILDDGIEEIDLTLVRTIWNRRPCNPTLPPSICDREDRRFAAKEWLSALDGITLSLEPIWINDPEAERLCTKPLQLEVAASVGLNIPETLITNDPKQVHEFLDLHDGKIIHKALTTTRLQLLETRRWSDEDSMKLGELEIAPTIFQAEVNGPADLRATVIRSKIYCGIIHSSMGRAEVDSRLDADAPCEPFTLPKSIESKIMHLMTNLGLVFGTVDLKYGNDGDITFLEVNSQGQFLYIQILTGLPIASGFADELARHC